MYFRGPIGHLARYQDLISQSNCYSVLSFQGMEKINFSGGEPFIHKRGEFVGELTRYCKLELKLPSVTIVCNGSLVTERWFKKYGV